MGKDYYKTLEIEKNASKEDIKKSFRKLAHKYHPDKGGGNEAKFKEISEAYSVLSDDKKRSEYDTYGKTFDGTGFQGQGGAGFEGFDFNNFGNFSEGMSFDLGDIFGDIFGGGGRARQRRGRDISIDIELDFKESIFGVEKKISLDKTSICNHCKGGGGEPGSEFITCPTCAGKGTIRENRRSILGTLSTTKVCDTCFGKGKIPKEKCKVCKGKGVVNEQREIEIQIPAGIENGEMIKLTGFGEAEAGGISGDLYVKIHVRKHPKIFKEGSNLIMDLDVKLSDALLGAEYNIEILDGSLKVKIPEGINFGEMLRIKGKGVPVGTHQRGDLFLKIKISIPKKLSQESRKQIEELKKEGL